MTRDEPSARARLVTIPGGGTQPSCPQPPAEAQISRQIFSILPGRPDLEPNPAEVDIVFDVPLAEFLAPDVYRAELWDRMGAPERPVHFFELEEDTVWGATARILHELLELVTLSGRTVPPEG